MTTITRDEWLQELEQVMLSRPDDADGLTMTELCALTSAYRLTVAQWLHTMQDRLIVGRKQIRRIDGVMTRVPCYRLRQDGEMAH